MNEALSPVLGYCFPVISKVFVQRNVMCINQIEIDGAIYGCKVKKSNRHVKSNKHV